MHGRHRQRTRLGRSQPDARIEDAAGVVDLAQLLTDLSVPLGGHHEEILRHRLKTQNPSLAKVSESLFEGSERKGSEF